jgi:transcriptional regulator with XRE-family HTH domain
VPVPLVGALGRWTWQHRKAAVGSRRLPLLRVLVLRLARPGRSGAGSGVMATQLAPVDARAVIRCDECGLVQFVPASGLASPCRRCHRPLEPEPVPVPQTAPPPPVAPTLATTLRELRLRAGLSQRQLAARMPVPRSYVSKLENEKATPTLSSLERVARALGVTVPELLRECERGTDAKRDELLADEWIAALAPHVSSLSQLQKSAVLAELSAMTRRSSSRAVAACPPGSHCANFSVLGHRRRQRGEVHVVRVRVAHHVQL